MFDTMEKTWLAKSARLTIVVTEKFTFKTKLLNAVAQLQSKSWKSSQHLIAFSGNSSPF